MKITLANSILLPPLLTLDLLRAQFEGGNQECLALAIHLCGQRGLSLPTWVVRAWKADCYRIVDRKVESWDDLLANGKRKTVGQLLKARIKAQKMFLIRMRAASYRDIPIRNNRIKLKRLGHRLVPAPDRFDTIAKDLSSDGTPHKVWEKCTRSEASKLWYELFPSDLKRKHKKSQE